MSVSRYLTLRTGVRMPVLALGTYRMEGDVVKEAVDRALQMGYRHIDTARSYKNEKDIGEVINARIKSGKLSRKDVFVTTKVPSWVFTRHAVLDSAAHSLENLKLKHVDMLLIHYPWAFANASGAGKGRREDNYVHNDLNEAWGALESVVDEGKAKDIGVSNFSVTNLETVQSKARYKPSNLQLECHAYLQQNQLRKYCKNKGIIVTAYAPLGAANYTPEQDRLEPGFKDPMLLEDPVVKELAKAYKRTPGQILLRFLLQQGCGALPKTQSSDRMRENMDVFDWELTGEDMQRMRQLDHGVKYFKFLWARKHPLFQPDEPF